MAGEDQQEGPLTPAGGDSDATFALPMEIVTSMRAVHTHATGIAAIARWSVELSKEVPRAD